MTLLLILMQSLFTWSEPAHALSSGDQLCVVSRLGVGARFGHSLLVYIDATRATVHNIESFHQVESDQTALNRLTEVMRGHENVEFSAFCAPLNRAAKARLEGLISGDYTLGAKTLDDVIGHYNVLSNNCTHMTINIYRAVTGQTLNIGNGFVIPLVLERAIRKGASGYPVFSTPNEFYQHICSEASLRTRIRCQ